MNVKEILEKYDKNNITIGSIGGHSALDVCRGAKKHGFKTVVVCQKGREKTYAEYYKTRTVNGKEIGCVDYIILVDKFSDIVKPEVQEKLRELNCIFIHNRYFWVYCNFREVEEEFQVPMFGSRRMLKLEERDVEKNQYYLMEKAGIRYPKIVSDPKDIDKLVIVKVNESIRGYERAFFYANTYEDYLAKSKELIDKGMITQESLANAVIEEFALGAQVNFNFFYSVLNGQLEFVGTDMRRQTNLDGILRLPANEQLEVLKSVKPTLVENGHITCTIKESIIEKAMREGEKFVGVCKQECAEFDAPNGIIGPFALQGAVVSEKGKEEIVIFDLSLRIPGSPGTLFTPYSGYLYGDSISYGERIAMEIKQAIESDRLDEVCS